MPHHAHLKADLTCNRGGETYPLLFSAAGRTYLSERGQEGHHTVRYSATHIQEKAANLQGGRGLNHGIFRHPMAGSPRSIYGSTLRSSSPYLDPYLVHDPWARPSTRMDL